MYERVSANHTLTKNWLERFATRRPFYLQTLSVLLNRLGSVLIAPFRIQYTPPYYLTKNGGAGGLVQSHQEIL